MAAPDAFLFELLDLLQLAFPGPVDGGDVKFAPADAIDAGGGEGRARAALVDLTAQATPSAPQRPDLGYPDDEVLDTLNAVLGDVVAGVEALTGDGVATSTGVVRFARDPDGAVVATVSTDDGREHYRRRIDRSEQYNLLHTPTLFEALNATEAEEAAQAARVVEAAGGRARFRLDVETSHIELGGADGPRFPAQLLASYHEESRTFVWGWANESFPAGFRLVVDEVRRGATAFGLRALAAPELLCPLRMADRLTRHAAVLLALRGHDVLGVYPVGVDGPKGKLSLFLLLGSRADEPKEEAP